MEKLVYLLIISYKFDAKMEEMAAERTNNKNIFLFYLLLGYNFVCNCVRDGSTWQCDCMRCHCEECINAYSD